MHGLAFQVLFFFLLIYELVLRLSCVIRLPRKTTLERKHGQLVSKL